MSRLVEFYENPTKPFSKKSWTVFAKETGTMLGTVHWYMATKRYVFQTVFALCYFDSGILSAITNFLRLQDEMEEDYYGVSIQPDGPCDDLEVQ
jgi:hypothetical protein